MVASEVERPVTVATVAMSGLGWGDKWGNGAGVVGVVRTGIATGGGTTGDVLSGRAAICTRRDGMRDRFW